MRGKKTFEKIKKQIESFSPFVKSWESAKALFTPKKIDSTLKESIKLADMNLAIKIFILASIIATFLTLLGLVEIIYLLNFTSETMTDVFGVEQQMMTLEDIIPLAIFHIITGIPLALFMNIGGEFLAYKIAKISGGKGTLAQHLYLISVITLALAMLNVIALALPIPCIQIIAWIINIVGMIYLWGYVASKAYSEAHNITFVHSLTIIIIVSIIRFAIMITVINWLTGALNLTEILDYQIGV
ncbi:MAG: hypothetical protein ABH842_02440 [Candidatus Micrarchaeota archaeon]